MTSFWGVLATPGGFPTHAQCSFGVAPPITHLGCLHRMQAVCLLASATSIRRSTFHSSRAAVLRVRWGWLVLGGQPKARKVFCSPTTWLFFFFWTKKGFLSAFCDGSLGPLGFPLPLPAADLALLLLLCLCVGTAGWWDMPALQGVAWWLGVETFGCLSAHPFCPVLALCARCHHHPPSPGDPWPVSSFPCTCCDIFVVVSACAF